MTDSTIPAPERAADTATPDGLVLSLIRLLDHGTYALKAKASAALGLAEAVYEEGRVGGMPSSAAIGLRQVADELETQAEELHERLKEVLDMARSVVRGGPEPEVAGERPATLGDVLDELRRQQRSTAEFLSELGDRVKALEAERAT